MKDEEYIQQCLEWIARHKAFLDQRKKMFEDQYPSKTPSANRLRLMTLEMMEFEIQIHEYELGGFIKDYIDKESAK